ncbi:MAG: ABC transporter substrate-binding protein [Chloroflexi bacterium]|nr:ABC transporter substrate-binding protein [Chloroflexota bacterium]
MTPEAAVAATASRAAATPTATPKRTEITFMAGFRAQANLPFVAAYVADAKGFFAEEGLRVQIQHSSGQDEHLKLLLDDKVQFTTGTAAQLLRRREDKLPVTGVALFGQRGDQAYVTRADSGIRGPADFKGRSVGFKAGVIPAELEAMLASVGLITKDVKTQAVGFDPRVFIEGQVDVYPVFINNEPYTIRKAGVAINVIDPANFGVPTLGVVFLANDRTVRDDPELVRRFLRATLRAAAWAERNVDEAVQITLKWAPGADAEHQRFLLTTDIENARRADGIGRADVAQWRALQSVLRRYGVLESDADLSGAFDQSFVDGLHAVGAIIADAPRGRS